MAFSEGPKSGQPIIVPKGELHKYRPLSEEEVKKLRTKTDILRAKTPEGKEIEINLQDVRNESWRFYDSHNLDEFAIEMPNGIKLTESAKARILEAMAQGFDRAIVIPGIETQNKVGLERLKKELADKELPGLSARDQYTESYLVLDITPATLTTPASGQAKRQKAYLLLYSSGPVPEATKNLTYSQAEALFKDKKWDGLTLDEYYLLQRKEAEKNKNHSFDTYKDNPNLSNWTRLLDSRVPDGCVVACWNPGARQVEVDWRDSEHRDEAQGARPTVVVEI